MKIGIITDAHIRGKTPVNRTDNFYESIMTKFTEALSIFKKQKCDIILDAGDLLHSPIISLTICDELLDVIDKNKINYYSIFGNHPMLNAHIKNSDATTLAHMFRRSEYLKYLEYFEHEESVNIDGYEYYHGIEEDIKNIGLIPPNYENEEYKCNIAVVHAMITEKKMMDKILHVPYKNLKCHNYDYVIVGHNHHEIGIQKVGNTTIIGLGALARLTADKKDYMRKPKVAILDTETKKIDVIELKTAKPYKEVFNLDLIAKKKSIDNNLSTFVDSLDNTELQSVDTMGLIAEVGKKQNVDKIVIESITRKVEELGDEQF